MFQITLTLYQITFNALQIHGRDPDEPIRWLGAVHLAQWWQISEHLYVPDNFNALMNNI
jgi:hypothetical protein